MDKKLEMILAANAARVAKKAASKPKKKHNNVKTLKFAVKTATGLYDLPGGSKWSREDYRRLVEDNTE